MTTLQKYRRRKLLNKFVISMTGDQLFVTHRKTFKDFEFFITYDGTFYARNPIKGIISNREYRQLQVLYYELRDQ